MSLPAIPPLSASWKAQVFSDNVTKLGVDGSEDIELLPDTERLAFIGETILHLGITNWLHERYPNHRYQSLRAKLLDLLTEKPREWARLYKLPSHVVVARTQGAGLTKTHPVSKGDLFRAYIGAVYLDHGGNNGGGGVITSGWIKEIMAFEEQQGHKSGDEDSDEDDDSENDDVVSTKGNEIDGISGILNSLLISPNESPVQKPKPAPQVPTSIPVSNSRNSLSILNEKATQKKSALDWDDSSNGPDHAKTWTTKLTVEGKEFTGTGHNKKQARSAAAELALKALKWVGPSAGRERDMSDSEPVVSYDGTKH